MLISLYNMTKNTIENNVSVCAVEYQGAGGFNKDDLAMHQKLNNEPKKKVTHIIGTNEQPMTETQLDMQMMSQVGENVDIWFWNSGQWLYSFAVSFLNMSQVPDILSMSWGWSEKDQCDQGYCPNNMTSAQYINRTNIEYIKMGLRGITIIVASGDAGAPGRTDELCIPDLGVIPSFPASSSYVTSVGATYLLPSNRYINWTTPLCKQYGCTNGTQELPANYNDTGWTTGGGFAIYDEKRPWWQNQVVKQYLNSNAKRPSLFARDGRGYPDISAIGHNCPIINNGAVMSVDGTSCSAPIFATLVALLNDYQLSQGKSKLGFINPLLYKMAKDDIFNDITTGNNWCTEFNCCGSEFGYESSVGWDPVTGLGTPNLGLMMDWLDKNM